MSFIGTTTFVSDKFMQTFDGPPVELGGRVLSELAKTLAVRIVQDYQSNVQVTKHAALRETEFKLELNVFTADELDCYYRERKEHEAAGRRVSGGTVHQDGDLPVDGPVHQPLIVGV